VATTPYRIVKLANGAHSVHSLAHAETFHPVVGPTAEGQALYLKQLRLIERLRQEPDEFVVWDVGLGAAANPLTLLRAARGDLAAQAARRLRLVSFDHTVEPLRFALQNVCFLEYLDTYESVLTRLMADRQVSFEQPGLAITWELHVADFPRLLAGTSAKELARPHAIMFDAFSPAKNPAMWTQRLFENVFRLLDPGRPCALPTYSRSTMLRVTLLLAGFFVGAGHGIGEKEETTIAANSLDLIADPLGRRWLERARRSTSAEPLWEPVYRQTPLSAETWARLVRHAQFQ
jgi:tRNA U34 5-methylaminomethyl-2-thiouridine-forming methyltransferase MnmC